jgi:glycosyltransferase involved in cell wall biosynthesis
MNLLRVSIAMATYNGEAHIREQLESLAYQTHLPDELVVTDDGSNDRTLMIIEEFSRTAPFQVRVFRNEKNLGFGDNFLKAAALCTGDVIAFCDQDDRWLPTKLSTCLEPFADPNVLICVHTSRLWYGGDEFGDCVPHFKRRQILPPAGADPLANYLGFSNLIRKEVLEIADASERPRHPNMVGKAREPHTMVHDQWIWFIASMFGKVAFVPEVQVHYRQHSGNTLGFSFKKRSVRSRLGLDKALIFAQGEEVALECATFAEALSRRLSQDRRASALRAAEAMRQRATVCGLRKEIYARESRVGIRLKAFAGVLSAHGYRAEPPAFSFGHVALLKDLIVGITGISRLLGRGNGRPEGGRPIS